MAALDEHTESSDRDAAILFGTDHNPVPEWARPGFVTGRRGCRLRYAIFAAQGRPLAGTVIILPGRNECIEKYFETIRDLSDRGLGVAMMDWRGQGGSGRLIRDPQRGYVDSFNDYVADLDHFFESVVLPDCAAPFYVLGHSTGALVALLATPMLSNRVKRMVLCAPLLALSSSAFSMRTLGLLAGLLFNLGMGTMYMSGGPPREEPEPFATNRLTTDPQRYARSVELFRQYPEIAIGGPTVAWVYAACRAVEKVTDPEFMADIRIPTLMLAGGGDEIVSTPAIEEFAARFRAGSLLTIDGARHELLQEADVYRSQLFAAFDAFIPGSDKSEF